MGSYTDDRVRICEWYQSCLNADEKLTLLGLFRCVAG